MLIDAPTIARRAELAARLERRQFRLGMKVGRPWTFVCIAADAAMLVFAAMAMTLGAEAADVRPASPLWTGAFGAVVMTLLATRGLYAPAFRLRTIDDVLKIVAVTSLAAMSLLAFAALTGGEAEHVADRGPIERHFRVGPAMRGKLSLRIAGIGQKARIMA